METPTQCDDGMVTGCAGAVPAAGDGSAFPPPGFVDVAGAAASFGVSSTQLYDWIRNGRLSCRGELVNGPNGKRGRIWPIAELERAREAMANPDGWVPGEEAQALFEVSPNTWNHWVKDKRVPQGRWGHGPTGKRCLLFPLDQLKRIKAEWDEEETRAQRALEPYPDPDRPGVYRLPVASEKHRGMEALIDADAVPLVQGKRWNWSGHEGKPGRGWVVWSGAATPLARIVMGVTDPALLVSHVNGDKLDYRRENLVVRTRSESRRAAKRPAKWDRVGEAYPDPDRAGVLRVPVCSDKHDGMEALIDADAIPLVQGKRWNWSPGKPDPAKDGSVVLRMTGTPKPSLARIILRIEDPEQLVCHRNGNRLDCRRENLVVRTREQVARAAKKSRSKGGKACSSRFKGVTRSQSGRKWYAAINVGGAWRRLGRFRSEIDAALAYDAALREVMGEDVAGLNLPDPAEAQRLRALEPVVEDGPWPPPGMVDRHEAAAMFGVSIGAWLAWEKKGRITCGEYHPLPNDKPGRCKLYPVVELERAREQIEKLGKPYADPDRPGVWRVPLKSHLAYREALIDEADLPIVTGKNWNWSARSDEGKTEGVVVLAAVGKQAPLHRMIAGVTDPSVRVSFVNGDSLDCRRANLAARTLAEISHASRPQAARAGQECTSKYKGVSWDADRRSWIAQISKDAVHRQIGRFDDEESAAQAYDDCARVWFGEHAYLNFPDRTTIEPARTWAQRIVDGTAARERKRKFRRLRMEKALRRAAREAKRREQMRVLGERDPWAGDDAWTHDPSVPKIGRHEARKLFGVSTSVWKRWLKVGWITCGQMADGRKVYPLAEIERLLEVCGRLRPPYPDPQLANVWRVPLFGRGMRRKEVLIDTSSLKLIEGARCTLGATKTDRGHVAVWFPAQKRRATLRRLITGVAEDASQNVQHRNGDILDCRRANLVVRTPAERTHTSRKVKEVKGKPPTSRFKGVCWHKGGKKWCASISTGKRTKYLGLHEREEDAARAYDRAALALFGPHAYFNFPRVSPVLGLVQVSQSTEAA